MSAPNPARRTVLFDLDGTLIPGDSVAALLRWQLRRAPIRRVIALVLLPLLWPTFLHPRSLTWGANVFSWLATVGRRAEALAADRRTFVDEAVARGNLHFFDVVKARLEAHLAAGDRVVIVTGASREMVDEIWRALDGPPVAIVASRTGPCLGGRIAADHCLGVRKLGCLARAGVVAPYDVVYSDSARDLPIWRAARHAVVVTATRDAYDRLARRIGGDVEWLRVTGRAAIEAVDKA